MTLIAKCNTLQYPYIQRSFLVPKASFVNDCVVQIKVIYTKQKKVKYQQLLIKFVDVVSCCTEEGYTAVSDNSM